MFGCRGSISKQFEHSEMLRTMQPAAEPLDLVNALCDGWRGSKSKKLKFV